MTDKWEGERGLKSFCCSLLQHCGAGARAASRQDGSETSVAVLVDCSHTQSLLYQRHNTVPGTHKKRFHTLQLKQFPSHTTDTIQYS